MICFLREAAIMSQFEHPNILQILAIAYSKHMKGTVYIRVNIECLVTC